MSAKNDALVVAGVGLAVLVLAWYAKKKASDAADALGKLAGGAWDAAADATKYVNPTSDQNIAYQGASALTRWLTGQNDGTLGTIAYDYVHKAEPLPGGGGLTNYTAAQQAADLAATRQLEAGFHGM